MGLSEKDRQASLGQFYTDHSPFTVAPFLEWWATVPHSATPLLEPFAGSGLLIHHFEEATGLSLSWDTYDIDPDPTTETERRDTLQDFPLGHDICITNPPWLAKNSARRRGWPFPNTVYDDLYKVAVDVALNHVPYLVSVLPESFLTQGQFTGRLERVLTYKAPLFLSTTTPACTALFGPRYSDDFDVYRGEQPLGPFSKLSQACNLPGPGGAWVFNDPEGALGVFTTDSTTPTIRFVPGAEIAQTSIKISSRAYSRISHPEMSEEQLLALIAPANKILKRWRELTSDTLMTPFKGFRKDNQCRRRLDFTTTKRILNHAREQLKRKARGPRVLVYTTDEAVSAFSTNQENR